MLPEHRDVFISFSSEDEKKAVSIYNSLWRDNISCWISARDIAPGYEWDEAIAYAIESANVVVVVLTRSAVSPRPSSPQWVANEVSQAFRQNKRILPLRLEKDVTLKGQLDLMLGTKQALDASQPPLRRHFKALRRSVRNLLQDVSRRREAEETKAAQPSPPESNTSGRRRLARSETVAVLLLAGGFVGGLLVGAEPAAPLWQYTPVREFRARQPEPAVRDNSTSESLTRAPTPEPSPTPTEQKVSIRAVGGAREAAELILKNDRPSSLVWAQIGLPLRSFDELSGVNFEEVTPSSTSQLTAGSSGMAVPKSQPQTRREFEGDGGLRVTLIFEMGKPVGLFWSGTRYSVDRSLEIATPELWVLVHRASHDNWAEARTVSFSTESFKWGGASVIFADSAYVQAGPTGAASWVPTVAPGPPLDKRALLPAQGYSGAFRVVNIVSGDVVRVVAEDGTRYRVRLAGIAAPRRGQDFGAKARRALAGLVYGERVDLLLDAAGTTGSLVAKILHNGRDVGLTQIQLGMAWHAAHIGGQLSREAAVYSEAEYVARLQGRGLWQHGLPVEPWTFARKRRGAGVNADQARHELPGPQTA